MTAFANLPEADEIPPDMVHVGWRCASPDHDCLLPRSSETPTREVDEVHLEGHNHHAHWVPVYAYKMDLEP